MTDFKHVNEDLYETLISLDFSIHEILQTFGEEVWENNNELFDQYEQKETSDAFVQIMLQQVLLLRATRIS